MLDFSWVELLIIIIVGVLVLGPKDLPAILYQVGKVVRRLQYMRFALSSQFDDFMQQAELQDPKHPYELADYKKPEPVYEQEEESSPFAKEPFHQFDDDEEDYDPDMEEDEEYVEQELSFLRDIRDDEVKK